MSTPDSKKAVSLPQKKARQLAAAAKQAEQQAESAKKGAHETKLRLKQARRALKQAKKAAKLARKKAKAAHKAWKAAARKAAPADPPAQGQKTTETKMASKAKKSPGAKSLPDVFPTPSGVRRTESPAA